MDIHGIMSNLRWCGSDVADRADDIVLWRYAYPSRGNVEPLRSFERKLLFEMLSEKYSPIFNGGWDLHIQKPVYKKPEQKEMEVDNTEIDSFLDSFAIIDEQR